MKEVIEVFYAKNGRPYIKDENGKVKFISNDRVLEIVEEDMRKQKEKDNRYNIVVTVVLLIVAAVSVFQAGLI